MRRNVIVRFQSMPAPCVRKARDQPLPRCRQFWRIDPRPPPLPLGSSCGRCGSAASCACPARHPPAAYTRLPDTLRDSRFAYLGSPPARHPEARSTAKDRAGQPVTSEAPQPCCALRGAPLLRRGRGACSRTSVSSAGSPGDAPHGQDAQHGSQPADQAEPASVRRRFSPRCALKRSGPASGFC